MLVMWGDGGGEGRRASTERQMDRAGQLKCLFLPFHFSGFLYNSVLWTLSKYATGVCVFSLFLFRLKTPDRNGF